MILNVHVLSLMLEYFVSLGLRNDYPNISDFVNLKRLQIMEILKRQRDKRELYEYYICFFITSVVLNIMYDKGALYYM